jgi:hypothetical protein
MIRFRTASEIGGADADADRPADAGAGFDADGFPVGRDSAFAVAAGEAAVGAGAKAPTSVVDD